MRIGETEGVDLEAGLGSFGIIPVDLLGAIEVMEVIIVFLLALDWFVVRHGDSPNCDSQDRLVSYRAF